jgi:hypothetical protein
VNTRILAMGGHWGSIIVIAKRDSVNTMDQEAIKGLEWSPGARGKDELG